MAIYTLSGATAALAGALLVARLRAGEPFVGENYELPAITAALLGGCALTGGKGSIIGGLLGAVVISVLLNGLTMLGVSAFVEMAANGILFIAAAIIAEIQSRKTALGRENLPVPPA